MLPNTVTLKKCILLNKNKQSLECFNKKKNIQNYELKSELVNFLKWTCWVVI